MRFSAKAEYGIWALLELALHEGKGPLQVKSISKRHHIPLRFLEQVMSVLKNGGFVESIRGAQGGYILAHSPREITLGAIVQSIEGTLAPMICISDGNDKQCLQPEEPPGCILKEVWLEVRKSILAVLDNITLQDLCDRYRAAEQKTHMMFHI